MNPPDLVLLTDFGSNWSTYEAELYRIFLTDLAKGSVQYGGLPVGCRRHTEAAGKWASFWHLVQEGPVEDEREPDLRRCERIRWVRWVIEHAATHAEIGTWQNTRGTQINRLLWFREEYLVVLGQRQGYWVLLTAYCTDKNGRIAQLRKERDAFLLSTSKKS